MGDLKHYVISGGIKGHERLKVLARVMQPTTLALFDQVGIRAGMRCLDVGCGSGAVTMELARQVGPNGFAVGVDIDETKLQLAKDEAKRLHLPNTEFRWLDIRARAVMAEFEIVYARFLLTHLDDPASAIESFGAYLKPGGTVIVEDIDFSGHFVYPPSAAFDRYHKLYCAVVRKRGGDPDIGPRIPLLLKRGGFCDVALNVVQPMSLAGEAKLISPITMENIAAAAIAEGLCTQEEVEQIVRALYEYAADPATLAGLPRVVQAWGHRR